MAKVYGKNSLAISTLTIYNTLSQLMTKPKIFTVIERSMRVKEDSLVEISYWLVLARAHDFGKAPSWGIDTH